MPISLMGRTGDSTDGPRVERVSVHQGAVQVDPPAVHAIAPPSRRAAESRGSLYVLIAPVGRRPLLPALTTELVKLIGETYYELTGSITRGLRGALLAANELLFDRNVRADAAARTIAGVVCAVIRQEDLYVAQMGPAVAIASRGMDSRRYPDHSTWITNEQPVGVELDREPPLGLRRDAEPSLFHASYRPDDLVVLASAGLIREASDGEVAAASLRTAPDDLTGALMDLANGRDFVLLVVRPAKPAVASVQPSPIVSTPPVSASQMAGRAATAPVIDEASGFRNSDRHDLPYSPFDAPDAPRTGRETLVHSAPVGRPAEERPLATPNRAMRPTRTRSMASARVAGGQARAARRLDDMASDMDLADDDGVEIIHTPRPAIDMAQIADKLTDRARRLRDGTESVLLGVLPKEIPPRPVEQDRPGISVGGKALVAVAMIIPLIVLFTVVMTRVQYDRARAAQYSNAISQAQYLYDLAVRQEDRQLKRDDLYRAIAVIDQGLALTPKNVDLQDLRRRAQHQVDQVEGVVPIYAFARLYFFEDGPASVTDSSRVAVHGKDVMVLNRGSDRVYRFFLNDVGDALQPVEANPIILRRGDVLDGETVTDLVDLNYMASEGSQTLARFIVLDRAGRLLSYDAARGMRSQPVGNADLWLTPAGDREFLRQPVRT